MKIHTHAHTLSHIKNTHSLYTRRHIHEYLEKNVAVDLLRKCLQGTDMK